MFDDEAGAACTEGAGLLVNVLLLGPSDTAYRRVEGGLFRVGGRLLRGGGTFGLVDCFPVLRPCLGTKLE